MASPHYSAALGWLSAVRSGERVAWVPKGAGGALGPAPLCPSCELASRRRRLPRIAASADPHGEEEPPRLLGKAQGGMSLRAQLRLIRTFRDADSPSPRYRTKFTKKKKTAEELEAERRDLEERERHQARTRTFTEVYGTLGREGAPLMLVDGYNVVMNDKFLAEIVEENKLSDARDALCKELRSFGVTRQVAMTVVWDAMGSGRTENTASNEGVLEIVYAAVEDADTYIKRRVKEVAAQGRRVHVVTGDYELQLQSRELPTDGPGASVVSSRELLMEMWQAQREVEAAARSLQLSNAARRATLGRVGGDAADALRQLREQMILTSQSSSPPSPPPRLPRSPSTRPDHAQHQEPTVPLARQVVSAQGLRGGPMSGEDEPCTVVVDGDALAPLLGLGEAEKGDVREEVARRLRQWVLGAQVRASVLFASRAGPGGGGSVAEGSRALTTRVLLKDRLDEADVGAEVMSLVDECTGVVVAGFRSSTELRDAPVCAFEGRKGVVLMAIEELAREVAEVEQGDRHRGSTATSSDERGPDGEGRRGGAKAAGSVPPVGDGTRGGAGKGVSEPGKGAQEPKKGARDAKVGVRVGKEARVARGAGRAGGARKAKREGQLDAGVAGGRGGGGRDEGRRRKGRGANPGAVAGGVGEGRRGSRGSNERSEEGSGARGGGASAARGGKAEREGAGEERRAGAVPVVGRGLAGLAEEDVAMLREMVGIDGGGRWDVAAVGTPSEGA